jgi:hypothetical protein
MNWETVFYVIFGLVAASMIFKIIKNRGWKGAMFGAPVVSQIGEMELARRGMFETKLKFHALDPSDGSNGPHVGVEVVHSSFGSWETRAVSLTRDEARRFAEELLQAAKASEASNTSSDDSSDDGN